MKAKQSGHFKKYHHEQYNEPGLTDVAAFDLLLPWQQVDTNHGRSSRSRRSANPSATASWGARCVNRATSTDFASTCSRSMGDHISTATRVRRWMAWAKTVSYTHLRAHETVL